MNLLEDLPADIEVTLSNVSPLDPDTLNWLNESAHTLNLTDS